MKLYKNIKRFRDQLGLSQEALAYKVGYTDRSSIAKIESGLVDLSASKIAAFASVFDVTPAVLLMDSGLSETPPLKLQQPFQCAGEPLTKEGLKVGLAYDQAEDGIQSSVRKLLDIDPDDNDAEEVVFSLAAKEDGLQQRILDKDQLDLVQKAIAETSAD